MGTQQPASQLSEPLIIDKQILHPYERGKKLGWEADVLIGSFRSFFPSPLSTAPSL